ncbi:hypothetical protein SERLA73DRAFT_75125 [Serpula lacrymans var. lacrymans S7.3]|uniref:Uncharacterized protein n=2 Tax=Serpula lacrymans var. lacrymans TaxID=341189 RepID=F8Q2N1_SERL3|nr:uncharacterized protein SERLADRAFT_439792 [Serpula lacrymans var. lacrymans S7.9]EGN97442.1 hypothetical protein SERLA73DRAFT_75125 [Serpula lacrymans var. lacrymans S7.3]EGO23034.1 hypothetical protein SERLADRAFT_439792 [Serpula lacrymans var. lacrymans S7.9]
MHPETEYYQIGGFRAHSNSWFRFDEKALIRAITSSRSPALRPSNDGIELVLGVLRSGATYVLMSREQMLSFTRLAGLRPSNSSWHSSAFISLSPISFSTAEEFTKKIQSYRQKSNKHREGEIQDNSPANKGYIKAVNLDGGIPRSAFEHQRYAPLYLLSPEVLRLTILKGKLEIHKFGLKETPWATAIRVVSFAFTPWTRDTRPYPIRLKKPQLLDVGWTELDLPIYLSTGRVNDTAHIRVKENRILGNPGSSKGNFQYGDSEMLDDSSIPSRIQKLMSHDEQSRDVPLVILVYNEKMARGVFAHYGIDTAYWESGISELLELDSSKASDIAPAGINATRLTWNLV